MTSTLWAGSDLLASRPTLRPDVVIGPGLVQGGRTVHHLKDPRTGWYFRVGAGEAYLAGRLDGKRTLAELSLDYAQRFGRRVDEAAWQQLLGLLAARRLLVGTDGDEELAAMAAEADRQARAGRSLLRARLPVVNPDRFLGWLAPRLRWIFSPWVAIPAALAVVVVEIAVLWHAGELAAQASGLGRDPAIMAGLIVVIWSSLVLHEAAHGLTCRHYGGHVSEIGVMWRFPLLMPYCKVDDVMIFAARRHRVLTAFAGMFASLLLLVPFAIAYPWLDAGPLRAATAALLLYGSIAALVNLVPFLQLDGYFMLNHALGMLDLRSASYRFLAGVGRRLLRRPGATSSGYPRRVRWIYGTYGVSSMVFGLTLTVGVLGYWLPRTWDRVHWNGVLAAAAAATVAVAVRLVRRQRRVEGPS